jgi:TolB-like protein/Flp pilus assembly protein TadD/predicted Ser/Thr protein kinase
MNPKKNLVLGNYRLLEKLGEGGMGVVWKARDLKLDRDVAIKFLPEGAGNDPDRRTFFEREAKAVAALSHPNIVTIFAVAEAEGTIFFTMELIDGRPLSQLIEPGGVSLDRFLELALPLVGAVAAAHARGIVHRDLKPQNIMIDATGALKILDFGLARILLPLPWTLGRDDGSTATLDTDFAGTIAYMSPEQLRSAPLDHRTDIFSIGVVLFEWATGRLPFAGKTGPERIAAVLKDEPLSAAELNPRLPRQIDRVLRHCLEKEPRYRMASAKDLREELEALRQVGAEGLAAGPPSIAVLPFADMSRERDQGYFCDGIAEEIINALCRIQGLRVASRTGSFQFKGAAADLREIGNTLRVDNLLEGSVRKSDNRLRITVQLVEAARGYHLWSESFDRELRDVFAIQQEIARNIARSLEVTLSPQEKGALAEIPTSHVQAYDYYLRGRSFYYRYGRHDIEFALQLFSRAVELDPEYALAHAGLADCWSYIYLYSERKDALRDQAEAAGRRAAELAPECAQAQASLAVALSLGSRKEEAQAAFERAIRLDPALFEAWYFYARHAFAGGDLAKAASLYEEAMRVRPENYHAPLLIGNIYDELGRHEDARAARERGVALVEKHIDLHPDDARALYMGANGLVALGERDKGLDWARRARRIDPDDPMLLYNLGCIHSLAGDIEEAVDCLERAAAGGLLQKGWYEHDGDLDPLRGNPRFKALLERM